MAALLSQHWYGRILLRITAMLIDGQIRWHAAVSQESSCREIHLTSATRIHDRCYSAQQNVERSACVVAGAWPSGRGNALTACELLGQAVVHGS